MEPLSHPVTSVSQNFDPAWTHLRAKFAIRSFSRNTFDRFAITFDDPAFGLIANH